jgi:hypothetical protein
MHQGEVNTDFSNLVFRARRYGPDYPGLAGRDLTPEAAVELYPVTISGTNHSPVPPTANDSVAVTSSIVAESGVTIGAVQLHAKLSDTVLVLDMYDDGLHQDGAADDSVFGATIPMMDEGMEVEYHIAVETDSGEVISDPVYAVENDVFYDYVVAPGFVCGDIDGSGDAPDVGDLVYLAAYMFQQGPEPPVFRATDVDGSGEGPNVADLVYLASYMFSSGPAPQCP